MKGQYTKWIKLLALTMFGTAVFMIADGYFWPGIAFAGAGTALTSAAGK